MSSELDPAIQRVFDARRAAGEVPVNELLVLEARAQVANRLAGARPAAPEITYERSIGVPGGSVPLWVYNDHSLPSAVVVYFHGGGWTVGSPIMSDNLCAAIARRTGYMVVSVDYRLAPEHRYPTPLNDAEAAVRWARASYPNAKIVLAGDSAGANLAASSAHRFAQSAEIDVALQVLCYPVLDGLMTGPSFATYGNGPSMLTRRALEWYYDQYVPREMNRADPALSPLYAPAAARLAPTYIQVAEFDPLRDDAISYARKLTAQGVPVRVDHFDDLPHGYLAFAAISGSAARAVDLVCRLVGEVACSA
jgi:acetyl esterase